MNTSFQIMAGVATMLAAGALLGGPVVANPGDRRVLDGCEVGGGGNDIHSLESRYDGKRNQIVVTLRLCAGADRGATYRLFLDRAAPFVEQAAAKAACVNPADAVVARGPGGHHGPGRSAVQGNEVRFIVPLDALGIGAASQVPVIPLWATSSKGDVTDRAPNPETGDDCHFPRAPTETLGQPLNAIGKLIWVGGTPFLGTIDGYQEADAACGQEAHDAGLAGSFVAWFSSRTSGVVHTINPTIGPLSTADGTMVALNVADLVNCTKGPSGRDCLRAPINLDIRGNRVQVLTWTETDTRGNRAGGFAETCHLWSSSSGSDTGDGGHVDRLDARWVTGNIGPCNQIRYLTCLQVGGTR